MSKQLPNQPRSRYDEISPITGNLRVLVEMLDFGDGKPSPYKICMESGFHTYPNIWNDKNPEMIAVNDSKLPAYMRDLKYTTNDGIIWYPICIIGGISLLLIKGENNTNQWALFNTVQTEGALDKAGDAIYIKDEPLKVYGFYEFEDAWEHYFTLNDATAES